MAFFIDTNIFVAALRGRAPEVREQIMRLPPEEIRVPHVVLAELRVGAAKSARPDHHNRLVSTILQPFAVVWPDDEALAQYVEIRVALEKTGQPISEPDLWIAAITRAASGTLVTHNTSEFERVPNLKLANWMQA
jgi:tRNA(fMet)-specific endonuclease VapC